MYINIKIHARNSGNPETVISSPVFQWPHRVVRDKPRRFLGVNQMHGIGTLQETNIWVFPKMVVPPNHPFL